MILYARVKHFYCFQCLTSLPCGFSRASSSGLCLTQKSLLLRLLMKGEAPGSLKPTRANGSSISSLLVMLGNSLLNLWGYALMCSNVLEAVLAANHKFMCVVVDMQIGSKHHDIVRVTKDFSHLLERNAFGFRKEKVEESTAECANDDEELGCVS